LPLAALGPIELQPVRRMADEPLFHSLLEQYHYLGYEQPVGEHLKYLVWAQGRPLACLGWSSAPRHLASRDRFIGWSGEARRRNIRFIAYNTRFLILPWVQVPHLASHILSRMARRLSADWERLYGHPIYFLGAGLSAHPAVSRATAGGLVERLDVTTEELEALLESVREPLGEAGYQKLRAAIRTLGYVTELLENRTATLERLRQLLCQSSTEKTARVLKQAGLEAGGKSPKPPGPEGTPEGNATYFFP